jgi:hypothetical protein
VGSEIVRPAAFQRGIDIGRTITNLVNAPEESKSPNFFSNWFPEKNVALYTTKDYVSERC